MFCTNCGTKINDGDSFCTNCGAKVQDKIVEILKKESAVLIKNARVISDYPENTSIDNIDTVVFGAYPQSDKSGKENEPLEWIVLDRNNQKALLLSKYVIDCKKMFPKYEKGSDQNFWSESDLRKWLNNDFYELAFSDEERKKIVLSSIDTYKSDVSYGVAINITDTHTDDYVFILTEGEIVKYFGFDYTDYLMKKYESRVTQYALASGAEERYWLRGSFSPNCYDDYVFIVSATEGWGNAGKVKADTEHIGVRPAMWVKFE